MPGARSQAHDPAESLMREVGAQLRQARLERGEDLNDVAQHLRIKSGYLFGIEQGDLSALPGRPYALGFLRTYADYLGFDGEDLITRIKSTVENLTDRTSLRVRAPMPENRLPKTPVVVISLAVVAGIYAGWSYINRSSRTVDETVAEVPSELRARTLEAEARGSDEPPLSAAASGNARSAGAPPTPADADPSGAAAVADSAAPALASSPDAQPRGAMAGASSDPVPPGTAPGPQATPEAGPSVGEGGALARGVAPDALAVQPAAGATPGVQAARQAPAPIDPTAAGPHAQGTGQRVDGNARVILRARERAWVQVSSPAGDYVVRRILEPGEAFALPDRADLELWTGNAYGLEILVDGKAVPALAGRGAVRRNVSLDPDRLLAAAAPPR